MIIERKILFGLDDTRALVFECGGATPRSVRDGPTSPYYQCRDR